jgi:hypothetical protein
LGLLAANISQIPVYYGLRSVLAALLLGGAVYGLLLWRMKADAPKAALLSLWFLLIFYSYGHVYGALEGVALGGWMIGRHRFLVVAWGLLFFAGAWVIGKKIHHAERFSLFLNWMGLALLVLPLLQIGAFELTRASSAYTDCRIGWQHPCWATSGCLLHHSGCLYPG